MSFYWFNARGISEWESRQNVNMKKDSCIAINSLNALWFMTKITFHLAILLRYRFSEVVNFQFPARYLQCDHNRVAIMIRESSRRQNLWLDHAVNLYDKNWDTKQLYLTRKYMFAWRSRNYFYQFVTPLTHWACENVH